MIFLCPVGQEFCVKNVSKMSGMSGIYGIKIEWTPCYSKKMPTLCQGISYSTFVTQILDIWVHFVAHFMIIIFSKSTPSGRDIIHRLFWHHISCTFLESIFNHLYLHHTRHMILAPNRYPKFCRMYWKTSISFHS